MRVIALLGTAETQRRQEFFEVRNSNTFLLGVFAVKRLLCD
jgi:hypothetical protein